MLDDIVNEYNNRYYSTIEMKPVAAKLSTYIQCMKKINEEYSKFKISDIARISEYKNIFSKAYVPNQV